MKFRNAAFLFDSTILGAESDRLVHGVVSFVGNPLYISAYAKDSMEHFDFTKDNANELKSWLSTPQNRASFAPFLIELYENVSKLGLLTYFIEKDYSAFTYLIGLMYNINTIDYDFHNCIDVLYRAYKSEYDDVIIHGSIDDIIQAFNERIKHIIQKQKGIHSFQNLQKEGIRPLNEQLTVAHLINENNRDDFMLADYYFYSSQILGAFKEKEVHNIFSTKDTALRFEKMTGHLFKSTNVLISENNHSDDFQSVLRFARVIMMYCHYFLEKTIEITDINALSEEDKYFFVLLWMVLQSGNSNLFINGQSYEQIGKLFLSLKKEVDA